VSTALLLPLENRSSRASTLVIVTEWEEFRALDFAWLRAIMARSILVDLRNVYEAEEVACPGFVYESVARPNKRIIN
jgi:UDPglucose 6-dehydrogenase